MWFFDSGQTGWTSTPFSNNSLRILYIWAIYFIIFSLCLLPNLLKIPLYSPYSFSTWYALFLPYDSVLASHSHSPVVLYLRSWITPSCFHSNTKCLFSPDYNLGFIRLEASSLSLVHSWNFNIGIHRATYIFCFSFISLKSERKFSVNTKLLNLAFHPTMR